MKSRLLCFVAVAAAALVHTSASVQAQRLPTEDVPEPLRTWIPWAMQNDMEFGCVATDSTTICDWPGRLELNLSATGGTFTMSVTTDRRTEVVLPGSEGYWPLDVRADRAPVPVLQVDGSPIVHLPQGEHRIEGRFSWTTMPERLVVPSEFAQIVLTVNGQRAEQVERGEDGSVWLHASEAEAVGENLFEFEVHRRLHDGVPMVVITRLLVHVSGAPREIDLGNALIPGSVATAVQSELPAQLSENGNLKLQVRAGTFTVEVTAFIASPGDGIVAAAAQPLWPEQEVWVWVPNETEREVTLGGASSVDPSRTSLPHEWRDRSAYLITPGMTLTTRNSRRGNPTPAPNALSLNRRMLLDPSGDAFWIYDALNGTMSNTWRVDLLAGELQRVNAFGADQLITRHRVGGHDVRGIEMRSPSVSLTAESRLPRNSSSVAAVGWSENVQNLHVRLQLPPGWTLFATTGVDSVQGTWMGRWTLWSFFFALLISIAFARMYGVAWGAVALVAMGLTYTEGNAPTFVWLFVLAAIALARVLVQKWLKRAAYAIAATAGLLLLVNAVTFSVAQMQFALFPQLASGSDADQTSEDLPVFLSADREMAGEETNARMAAPEVANLPMQQPVEPAAPPPVDTSATTSAVRGPANDNDAVRRQFAQEVSEQGLMGGVGRIGISDQGRIRGYGRGEGSLGDDRSQNMYLSSIRGSGWIDPSSTVQTGVGMPDWSHGVALLNWSGPVQKDHKIDLFLIAPWLNRLLALLRVALIAALFYALIRNRPNVVDRGSKSEPSSIATAVAAAFALVMGLHTTTAGAQSIPPTDVIESLHERLSRAPACSPNCVDTSRAEVRVGADALSIELNVSSGATWPYPLPGPATTWEPEHVFVDGRETTSLIRGADGVMLLRLPEGSHTVRLVGSLHGQDALTLAFADAPHVVDASGDGWIVEGRAEEGARTSSLQLRRTLPNANRGETQRTNDLPAWFTVERHFEIGVTWRVSTAVTRMNSDRLPATLRIPLMQGESVTTAGAVVEGREIVVTLPQGSSRYSYESSLTPSERLSLTASTRARQNETFSFACTPLWHCTFEGIAPIRHDDGNSYLPVFHPWPGERFSVAFERPTPADGHSVAIDLAELDYSPGVRMTTVTLSLSVRASRGQPLTIEIPHNAEIRSLSVNSQRAVQRSGDVVTVALEPGTSPVTLQWQEPRGIEFMWKSSQVRLNGAPANARVAIHVPNDRWLLWTSGPAWGPAILFWPYLLLILLVAFAIGRSKKTHLGYRDAFLLGLGLTQIPAVAALVPLAWFVWVKKRSDTPAEPRGALFNTLQIFLFAFTLATAGVFVAIVYTGLLVQPDMQVAGAGSYYGNLVFYVPSAHAQLPNASVISAPLWVWRVLQLVWALWLAERVVQWAKLFWTSYVTGGGWHRAPKLAPMPPSPSPDPSPSPSPDPSPNPSPNPSQT